MPRSTDLPLYLVLLLGSLSAFGPMSIDMYLPAFPALATSLGTTPGMVAYTLSAFFIGLSVGQLVYGPLADRFGRRTPLLVGLFIFVLASVGCAFAPNIEALIAMRVLQALGGCAGMVISRAAVRDMFDQQTSARVFSMLMLVMGVAPILAPFLGGLVLDAAGWRGIFWSLAAFGAACLAAVALKLPETLSPDRRVRLSAAEIGRVYGRLLGHRGFVGFALAGAFAQAGMFAYIAGSPFVFISLHHVPANMYGVLFGLNAAGLIGASQLNGHLLKRHASMTLLVRALGFAASMAAVLAVNAVTGWGGFVGLLVPLFGFLASLGFITPNTMAAALGTQHSHHGQASAMLGTIQFAIATLAGVAIGALQDGTARPMGLTIAVCGLLGLTFCLLSTRRALAPATESAR